MEIPIFNSIYSESNSNIFYNTKELNFKKINNLKISKPNIKIFNSLKSLKLVPKKDSLFETVLISVNDELVDMFLKNKIKFKNISIFLMKIINFKIFKKYCNISPKSIDEIITVRKLAIKTVENYVENKI